jgi:phage-related protein
MPIYLPVVFKSDPKGLTDAENSLSGFGKTLGGIGAAAGAAFAAASVAAGAFAVSSIKAAADSEAISRGMQNAVANTQLFGSTAADISKATDALDKHSTKLAEMTGIDDELINQIKTHWMEVPAISAMGIDGINKMAQTAADVAAGTGKDIESVSNIFSKALENPETALGKLQKAGIFVTDSQKEIYDSMIAAGDAAGAQGYLMDQLGEKYKGAAEAAANPFDRLKVIFENLQETVGKALLPAIEAVVPVIADFFNKLTASPDFTDFMVQLADTFSQLLDAILPILPPLMDMILSVLPPLMDLIGLLAPIVVDLINAFMPLIDGVLPPLIDLIETLLPPIMELVMAIFMPLIPIIVKLVEAFAPMIEKILPPLLDVVMALVPVFFALIDAFLPLIETLLPPLLDLFLKINEPMTAMLKDIIPFLIPIIEDLGKMFKWMVDNILGPLITGLSTVVDWFNKLMGFDGKSVNIKTGMTVNNDGTPNRDGNPATPFANGGIVLPSPGGTLARIGEAGKAEAVIPLDRLDSMMGGRGGGSNITINVTAGMGADGAAIGEQIVTAIRKYERTSGKVFAAA